MTGVQTCALPICRLVCGDTTADLSVDAVEVLVDGRTLTRFDELEVELDAGSEEPLQALRSVVGSSPFKQALTALGGYEVSHTGEETRLE